MNGAVDTTGLDNLALYALDCAVTLQLVLEVYPAGRRLAAEDLQMTVGISKFYDEGIPELYKLICENSGPHAVGLKYLNSARIELLNAFHGISNFFLENLLSQPNDEESAEKIVSIYEESLDHNHFIVDYQKIYPVENDFDVVRQGFPGFNALRLNYIQAGYKEGPKESVIVVSDDEEDEEEEIVKEDGANGEATSDLETLILQVIEVFPDFGDGFVRKLLSRYEMNSGAVISAILEGNLPPDLANANKSEVYVPPERAEFFVETGIKRLNIFDGDEFDVLTNDKVSGIYRKGVGEPKVWEDVLNDKAFMKPLKTRYDTLGYVSENEYDDEYDDSYDAMAESEAKTVRISAAARNLVMDEAESDPEEEPQQQQPLQPSRDASKDFCENPEAARLRYEQARQAKFHNRGGGGRKSAVVGKPKGQGQSDETQKSRKNKEAHKSSSGNHNRKNQASFKSSRGMYWKIVFY